MCRVCGVDCFEDANWIICLQCDIVYTNKRRDRD